MVRVTCTTDRGEVPLGWVAAVALAAGLVAAIAFVMAGRSEVRQARSDLGSVGQAQDASVQVTLETAIQAAESHFAENGTYVGFDAATAASFDPTVAYNAAPAAIAGQVSIRGASATSIVLASRSESGAVLCIAAVGDVVSRGRVDAATAPACTGGW